MAVVVLADCIAQIGTDAEVRNGAQLDVVPAIDGQSLEEEEAYAVQDTLADGSERLDEEARKRKGTLRSVYCQLGALSN